MPTVTARTLSFGARSYPLVLPNVRDPRLHVAAVIITIHVLGQVGLGFRVSVPQILAAIVTCAVLEIALTFRQTKSFVWPASAMLTGSGVALILRVVGTPPDDHWTFYAWYVYAAVAGLSLLSKYVVRYRGSHVFNPSNIGLVVTFVVLGTSRVEPLDFWWAPLNVWMILAYAVILIGGLLITRRLHLLALAASFWIGLAAGTGILAGSGHCMTASWAFAPVCGIDFWRVIVTSPEVLIFLFFMITDPKTVPIGAVGRVIFGALVAVASTLLMAPQTDEFGTKVGLLAGLVVLCAVRPLLDRVMPEPRSAADDLRAFAQRLFGGPGMAAGLAGRATRVGGSALAVVLVTGAIVAAGTPARGVIVPDLTEVLNRTASTIDSSTLPRISVGQDVTDFDHELAGPGMEQVVVTLAQNLEIENQALLRRDASLLPAVDHGDRLLEMQARLQDSTAGAPLVITHYQFDAISASLLVPFGKQDGLSLGLAARGTMVQETYDGAGTLIGRQSTAFDQTFAMRRATGARWLNVAVLPTPPGS
jgi:Na+-translocating ferredoxin:NAD+ oxidoreductase RnfD subunit